MNQRTLELLTSERGIALLALLMILSSLTVLSVGFLLFSTTEQRIANNQKDHVGALYTAEAGVAEIVTRMEMKPGALADVNGAKVDPYIGDDELNPDPNWRTEVYLAPPDRLPSAKATETIVPTVQPKTSWLHYGDTDLGLAPIVIEHKWVDRNRDGIRNSNEIVLYDASKFPHENFATGFPVSIIRVPAHLNGSRRTVLAEITRFPLTARAGAAITSDRGLDLKGNFNACGHNHNIETPVGTRIPTCRLWELCANRTQDLAEGCLVSVMSTGDPLSPDGSSDVEGFPTWSDTSSANPFHDVWGYLGITKEQWDEVASDPDYTSSNDAVIMDGIVIVDGDATGTESFNDNDGQGLIYVNGDMTVSGNFRWKGLIYVEGDCRVAGSVWILGAICIRGATDPAFAGGNSTILYSRESITAYVGRNLKYQRLAWNEL